MPKPKQAEKPRFVTKPIGGDKNGKERTVRVKKLVSKAVISFVKKFVPDCLTIKTIRPSPYHFLLFLSSRTSRQAYNHVAFPFAHLILITLRSKLAKSLSYGRHRYAKGLILSIDYWYQLFFHSQGFIPLKRNPESCRIMLPSPENLLCSTNWGKP